MHRKFYFLFLSIFFICSCQSGNVPPRSERNYARSFHLFKYYPSNDVYFDITSMPEYGVGDGFLYDNGLLETVKSVKDNKIIWQDNFQSSYITSQNPLLSLRSWEWEQLPQKRKNTKTKISHEENNNFLWPLRIGTKGGFYSYENIYDNGLNFQKKIKTTWNCEVLAIKTIVVPAGKFDSFEISCVRKNDFQRHMTYKLYYSPVISHWIKKTYIYDGDEEKTINLVEAGPISKSFPDHIKDTLNLATNYALEYKLSNQTLRKHIKEVGVTALITPKKTFQTKSGNFCRRYTKKLEARGRQTIYHGTACRDKDKKVWLEYK